jgi:hypothetical protein
MSRQLGKFTRLLIFILGMFVGGIGLLVGLLEVIAIIDPVGTKLADDADPLGDPYILPVQHAFHILLTVGLLSASYWLMRQADRESIHK